MTAVDEPLEGFVIDPRDLDDSWPAHYIGSGQFGTVYRTTLLCGGTELPVALRVFNAEHTVTGSRDKTFVREIENFALIKPHPCFCLFRGYLLNLSHRAGLAVQGGEGQCGVVMDYIPNGSLQAILEKSWKTGSYPREFTGTVRAKTIFGFAVAMMHLHARGVVHRFLTPKNVLYNEEWEPKLTDFGLARAITDKMTRFEKNDTSSFWIYKAPEVYTGATETYTEKVDVWSYGMIIYSLITGKKPTVVEGEKKVRYDTKIQVIEGTLRPEIPPEIPESVQTLIQLCWDPHAPDRPSFAQIVRELLNYDEPLVDGVDMDEYRYYRDRIMDATPVSPHDQAILDSIEISDDELESFDRLKAEAERGDVKSLLKLANCYRSGRGTPKNPAEAFACFTKVADAGNRVGMFETAWCLIEGFGTERNPQKGVEWLEKCMSYPRAASLYARCLHKGIGVKADRKRALELFKRLSEPPHSRVDAMDGYARMLEEDPATQAQAREWYSKASDAGSDRACCNLAYMLLEGKGGAKDVDEAIRLYKRAATHRIPEALFNLGLIYENGRYGQKKDPNLAEGMYREAKKCGYERAHVKLAKILMAKAEACGDDQIRYSQFRDEAIRLLEQVKEANTTAVIYILGKLKAEKGIVGDRALLQEGLRLLAEAIKRPDGGEAAMFLGDFLSRRDVMDILGDRTATRKSAYQKAAGKGIAGAREKLAALGG